MKFILKSGKAQVGLKDSLRSSFAKNTLLGNDNSQDTFLVSKNS